MFDPFLPHQDFLYTRLLAISWHTKPLQPALFTAEAGEVLLKQLENRCDLPILLNCANLTAFEDHSLSAIQTFIQNHKQLCMIFIVDNNDSIADCIKKELDQLRTDNQFESTEVDHQSLLCFGCRSKYSNVITIKNNLNKTISNLEDAFLERIVKDCHSSYKENILLESTPLWTNGFLNALELIADPKKFVWVSIKLAELFQTVIEKFQTKENRLLAISLRGSPLAAAVRMLSVKYANSLEVIDHIGPVHDLLENDLGHSDMRGREYILIVDFVIAGTELKVAKSYAMAKGACLKHAIAVGAYLPLTSYQSVSLSALVDIPSAVPDLKFTFSPNAKG